MADMQTYGHGDIQRYLQHKMTPQEMHDFEKALMNDPFLADALEGFSSGDVAVTEKHLSEIQNELTGEKQEGKVVALPLQKTTWRKVAAVVLVVAASGVLTYSLLTKSGAEKNITQQMAPAEVTEMAAKTDSIGPSEKPLAQVEILPKKELYDNQENTSPIVREEKEASGANMRAMSMQADSVALDMMEKNEETMSLTSKGANAVSGSNIPAASAASAVESKKITLPAAFQNEFKGRVINTNNQPLTAATISIPESNLGAIPDSTGHFTLKAKDSLVEIRVDALGYASKELTIKSNASVDVVLEERQELKSDVAEADVSEKKKRKMNARGLIENIAKVAEPEGGWKKFEQYVNRQIDSLKANDDDNHYSDDVELEFLIDEKGQPVAIKAHEKADRTTAEKAIQILTTGPKWKSNRNDKKVKVVIPFNK